MLPNEVDADWLTAALGPSVGTTAAVVRFRATSIGTGQVGENVRFDLDWSTEDPNLPSSVVGKFPSASEISRATAVQMNTYVKETGFYRDLQSTVSIRTPQVHTVEWDPASHDFAILMEDIRPARQGDQLQGCGIDEARLAVDQAIGLHAPTWGRAANLAQHEWLGGATEDEQVAFRDQLFAVLTPGFIDRFSARLSADDVGLAEPLTGAFATWMASVHEWADRHDAWCVVHGDYRLDNLLFGESTDAATVTVVDWQTVAIGTGPNDIAYFCGAGLLPDVRRTHERALVERYANGLRAAGVDIADDDAWDGYVLGSATGYFMAVLASQVVERTERGDEMFAVMAERHADQIRMVGLLDRLGIS